MFHLHKFRFFVLTLAGGEQHFMLFADGKSTGDSRMSGARGVAALSERSDGNILDLLVFLLTENEATQDARILPAGEYRSAPLES